MLSKIFKYADPPRLPSFQAKLTPLYMSTLEETHMIGLKRSLLQYYLKHIMLHVYGGQEACRRVVDNALVRPIDVSSSFPVASILLNLISTRAGKNVGLEKCFYVFLCFLMFFYRFFCVLVVFLLLSSARSLSSGGQFVLIVVCR